MGNYDLITHVVAPILFILIAFAPVVIYTALSPFRQDVGDVFSTMWIWIILGPAPSALVFELFGSKAGGWWLGISWLVGCAIAIQKVLKERRSNI